ncbi:MAG TPA: 2-amino-4-hydroxy-6-hydroxymethyldihydropteridine diphosphokinase [Thermomicrobiales bacterium]|nr:2-amino-4-hydroxy-6-hydroxymethyldihydropteridine diphosphokinase [Thermomicrobiales bacterium]
MASLPSVGLNRAGLVAIALGSNLGDRRAHLGSAVERLAAFLVDLRVSDIIETDPLGVTEPQPPYLNAAVVGRTTLPARSVLDRLLAIEAEGGRVRLGWRSPRTLDLDLILHGQSVIDEDGLQVPHPRFRERAFVLEPLAQIAPEMRDPVSGATMGELLAALRSRQEPSRQP